MLSMEEEISKIKLERVKKAHRESQKKYAKSAKSEQKEKDRQKKVRI